MQTRAPRHLRGRVVGVMGSLADSAGLHVTFLALSLPMLLLGIVAIFLPGLRDLDRPPPGTQPSW